MSDLSLPAPAGLVVAPASLPALALAVELAADVAPNVNRYLVAGLEGSPNTQRAYAADLRTYEAYCALHQVSPWPADGATLAGYVAGLADGGRKLATINRHLAAIEKSHQLRGLPSVVNGPALSVLRLGVARVVGKKQRQAPAFTVAHLKQCLAHLDLTRPEDLRLRALLLLGFAGAFRRSELVALDLEHVELTRDALVLTLPRSKTNQYGEEEKKAVFYATNRLYCPIRAYQEWVALLGRTSGPAFVSLNRLGTPTEKRLIARRVNLLVKEALGPTYSAHSLRASFITTAKLAGQSNEFIKNQTKQKTDVMISRYSRLDDIIRYNAAHSLGL